MQHKNGWRGESRFLWMPAEPRCSVPLSQSAASTFLYRLETGQGHSTGVLQLVLLRGVGGGVMNQAPSKAGQDLDRFSPWKYWTLHNHQNTFWVNDLAFKDQGSSWAKNWSSSLASQSLLKHQSLRYLQKLMLNLNKNKSFLSIYLVFHAVSFVLCCRWLWSLLSNQGQLWLWVSAEPSTMQALYIIPHEYF